MQIKSMKPTCLSHLWFWGSVPKWLEVAGLREDWEGLPAAFEVTALG